MVPSDLNGTGDAWDSLRLIVCLSLSACVACLSVCRSVWPVCLSVCLSVDIHVVCLVVLILHVCLNEHGFHT